MSMRTIYNYKEAVRASAEGKLERQANAYSIKLVADVPDDYPGKSELAEMHFYQYVLEQGEQLSSVDQQAYGHLLLRCVEIDNPPELMEDENTQREIGRIGSLAVEFAD